MSYRIDLFIVGAQKAGTTSLKNYLKDHPQIISHEPTEFSFFVNGDEYNKGFDYAWDHYFKCQLSHGQKVVAKSAAMYFNETGLKRLKAHNPDCELVFVLRNPVERAYSSFTMEKSKTWIDRGFEELISVIKDGRTDDVMYKLFIELGLYVNHLEKILKFFPSERVHVYLFEEMAGNPGSIYSKILDLLSIEDPGSPMFKVHNRTLKKRSVWVEKLIRQLKNEKNPLKRLAKIILPYSVFTKLSNALVDLNTSDQRFRPMDPEIRDFLHKFFEPYNEKLGKLTGYDLSDWETSHE